MKAEFINPFLFAASNVLSMYVGQPPSVGKIVAQPSIFTIHPCNAVIGVTGQAHGHVICGMPLEVAREIASAMLGQPVKEFDQLAASAIAELANMISGNAMTLLAEAGLICDVTPPSIVQGTNIHMSMLAIPALIIPLCIPQGEISLTVALQVCSLV